MKPIIEPPPRRINLHNAHPRNRHMRPDRREQRRNRVESLIGLIGALCFCWWLGGRIHAAVMAGSKPFLAVANQISEAVSGK